MIIHELMHCYLGAAAHHVRTCMRRIRLRVCPPRMLVDVYQSEHRKSALLVYIVAGFHARPGDDRASITHQGRWRGVEIARILDAKGYRVDAISSETPRVPLRAHYDLLVGLGEACWRAALELPSRAKKIYLMTGAEGAFNNRQELERLRNLKARRGRHLKPRRLTTVDSRELTAFDAIGCIGNDFTVSTMRPFHEHIFKLPGHGDPGLPYPARNFEDARHHFLYLGSYGQVHKGLDLLLEAFVDTPDCHLHVCGPFRSEVDFVELYHRELFGAKNIHPVGWVWTSSPAFEKLARTCATVVLPSCSEGAAGGVITGMHTGLIPIVTPECGVDVGDAGFVLSDCDPAAIRKVVGQVSRLPGDDLGRRSAAVRELALTNYGRQAFTAAWTRLVDDVLGEQS